MTAQAQASKLDIDKFAKVHRLMMDGATDGERAAARSRAEAMASRAFMTLKQAVSEMDRRSKPADPLAAFHEAARRGQAERSARYADRRAHLLKRYGSVKAVFDPRPIEAALFMATTPFAIRMEYEDYCGTKRWYSSVLGGATGWMDRLKISDACKAAIAAAWPIPTTLAGLLAEARMWDEIRCDRQAFVSERHDYDYEVSAEADCRCEMIEHELNTRPVTSWDDMQARFDWKRFAWERQWINPSEEREDGEMPTLRRDFEILRKLYETAAQNGHDLHHCNEGADIADAAVRNVRRTNADKRRDVMSRLDAEPYLTDREIARRSGVSPQTVGNVRRYRDTAAC